MAKLHFGFTGWQGLPLPGWSFLSSHCLYLLELRSSDPHCSTCLQASPVSMALFPPELNLNSYQATLTLNNMAPVLPRMTSFLQPDSLGPSVITCVHLHMCFPEPWSGLRFLPLTEAIRSSSESMPTLLCPNSVHHPRRREPSFYDSVDRLISFIYFLCSMAHPPFFF